MAFTLSVIKNSTSAYNIVVPGGFEPPQTEPKSYVLTIRRTDDNKNEDLINSVSKYFYFLVKFRSN